MQEKCKRHGQEVVQQGHWYAQMCRHELGQEDKDVHATPQVHKVGKNIENRSDEDQEEVPPSRKAFHQEEQPDLQGQALHSAQRCEERLSECQ